VRRVVGTFCLSVSALVWHAVADVVLSPPSHPDPLLRGDAKPSMPVPEWQWKAVLFVSVFLSCISFSVVMPSLWPYLKSLGGSKEVLAWVVAVYSIGEAIGAVLFGLLSASRSTRDVMLIATCTGLAGSIMYLSAQAFPGVITGPLLILVGRFLQGLWTGGSQAVQQSHLAKTLPVEELTSSVVVLNAFACLGFIFGPSVALMAAVIPDFTVPGLPVLRFTELTAAGYVVLVSTGIILFLFAFGFQDGDQEHHSLSYQNGAQSEEAALQEQSPLLATLAGGTNGEYCETQGCRDGNGTPEPQSSSADPANSVSLALIVCNAAFFTHFYGFALQETITTPLVQNYYDWTVFQANLLFTAAGVASLCAFAALAYLSCLFEDRMLATWSLGIGALGFAMLVSTPEYPLGYIRFLAGFMVISVAFPLGRAAVIALYTKLLPMKWQGSGQGVILAVGATARILGPFWAIRAFDNVLGDLIVFGGTALLFLITMGMFGMTYGSLVERRWRHAPKI
jgi:MFS transporter, ceroid-lipofuscinosis neuronal protein 7